MMKRCPKLASKTGNKPTPSQIGKMRHALTLTEVVVSTLLVGTVLVSSLYTSLAMNRSYQGLTDNSKAIFLAERYLTEIMQSLYKDHESATFGLEPGESSTTRLDFDDVDDYHGRTESPPTSKSGEVLADYGSDWSVSINVTPVTPTNPLSNSPSETSLKKISVSVTNPQSKTFTLHGLRSSAGGKDLTPKRNGSYAQWIGLTIRTEEPQKLLHVGTQPMNLSEAQ